MNTKAGLYEELKSIDNKVRAKDQIAKLEETFEQENIESTDFDKRLALYRKLKEQMLADIANTSEVEQKAKMEELNRKIQALEKAKKEKERRDMLQKQAMEAQRDN